MFREVGKVWGTCDETKKLPVSNRAAYRREIMESLSELKDTSAEFSRYMESSRSTVSDVEDVGGTRGGDDYYDDEDEDEDEDEDDIDDFSYSTEELPAISRCIKLIDAASAAIKFFLQGMARFEDEITIIDDVSSTVLRLRGLVVDTGSEMYSPIDKEILLQVSGALFLEARSFIRIMEACPILLPHLITAASTLGGNEDFVGFISSFDTWNLES
jgi:hypothetical protein